MADYANQHFLPKSYLKNFATDKDQKHIGVYVYSRRKHIKSGAIKPQCRRLHFYGEDGELEKKLSVLEDGFQKLILEIAENQSLPDKSHPNYQQMLFMWLVTFYRNPTSSEQSQAFVDEWSRLSKLNPNDYDTSKYEFKYDFVGQTLRFSNDSLVMVQDLNAILLINNTQVPFVTSDNPIVHYNQLAEKNKLYTSATGLGCIGIQSFFPISPKLAIMFYDPNTYVLFAPDKGFVQVNAREVFSLNLLQFLNNLETIYFNEQICENDTYKLHEAAIGFDRKGVKKSEIMYAKRSDNSLSPYSGIYSVKVSFSAIELDLSFMSISELGKSIKMKDKKVLIRDSWREAIKSLPEHQQKTMIEIYERMQNCESIDQAHKKN